MGTGFGAITRDVYPLRGGATASPTVATSPTRTTATTVRTVSSTAVTKCVYRSQRFAMALRTVPTAEMSDSAVN